jgi:hypothetical protein
LAWIIWAEKFYAAVSFRLDKTTAAKSVVNRLADKGSGAGRKLSVSEARTIVLRKVPRLLFLRRHQKWRRGLRPPEQRHQ